MIPRMVSQAGTIMVLSYFAMKAMNMINNREAAVASLEAKGIPAERAQILYIAQDNSVLCNR